MNSFIKPTLEVIDVNNDIICTSTNGYNEVNRGDVVTDDE